VSPTAPQKKSQERRLLHSIYDRAGRICADKGQAHLRDFAKICSPEEKATRISLHGAA